MPYLSLHNDTEELKVADIEVTPGLEATHTCHGNTVFEPLCHAERSELLV